MHDEHDRTHGHGLTARPRGRMPYGDPPLRQPPPSAGQPPFEASHAPEAPRATEATELPEPPEPIRPPRPARPPESRVPVGPMSPPERSERPEEEGAKAPRRSARHRKDEEGGESGDACPPVRDSRTYLDSRPFSMPPPPGPWRRPWLRLSRDQLLRPALIAGFLAAAGVGVWSSGWSPWDGVPTAGTSPASSGEGLLLGHDMVITPSAPGVDVKATPEAREDGRGSSGEPLGGGERSDAKTPRGRVHGEGPGRERAGRAGGGDRKGPGRAPAERALSFGGDTKNEWVERVERAGGAKKPDERPVRHREGGSARTAAGSGETGNAASKAGAGRESGRRTGGGRRGSASGGRGAEEAGTAGRPRSGAREGGSPSRAGRTGAPATGSPPPSASRSRPAGGGRSAGISATYACRHLSSTDWRHAYCVQVWNDYKSRNGLR